MENKSEENNTLILMWELIVASVFFIYFESFTIIFFLKPENQCSN